MSKIEAVKWFLEEHRIRLLAANSKTFKSFSQRCQRLQNPQDILLKPIPRLSSRAQLALSKWLDGSWPIILSSKIPSPSEMLEAQASGSRVVSWLPDIVGTILDKEDNWEFMLHDLMHAERFFYCPSLYRAQVGFFNWLRDQNLDISGPKWDYLQSDMNTHPLHSLQFLKHLLNSKGVTPTIRIPHWDLINSSLPHSIIEEIGYFFQTYKSQNLTAIAIKE